MAWKERTVRLLEDEHGSETDGVDTAGANVDEELLHRLDEGGRVDGVEGDKHGSVNNVPLALASQVLDVLGVLGSELLELGVEDLANAGGLLDEFLVEDLTNNSAAHDDTGWVADPGVELAVGLVGDELAVAEEVAGRLGLLGEGDDVGRGGEVPVGVAPELSGGAEAGLDLVDDEGDAVLLRQVTETLEEGGGGVVVAALALDGLDDEGDDGEAPRGVGEGEDGEVGGAGLGVLDAGGGLLVRPVDALTTLLAAVEHHGGLEGQLVSLGS
ncbi:unnamed protein product [Clonostachys rosea f. rosea IK726]|uniref:Uncharacterized protein n=1 Tax=Clonostachys rosea f. rosea IK726 TaxID=1349383 RepID=A0ACA9TJD5_BIOOC|nr:unnamed protein product [Clonostachys rosea f. rosea IK726]